MQAINDNKYQGTAEVYENAGICAWQSGQEEKAIQYLETAIVRDPHRYDALLSLAEINLKNKKYLIAKDYLKRFNAATSSTAYSILLEIKLSQLQDDFSTAKDKALLLKKLFPDFPVTSKIVGKGDKYTMDDTKIKKLLGRDLFSPENCLKDMFDSLVKVGLIKNKK